MTRCHCVKIQAQTRTHNQSTNTQNNKQSHQHSMLVIALIFSDNFAGYFALKLIDNRMTIFTKRKRKLGKIIKLIWLIEFFWIFCIFAVLAVCLLRKKKWILHGYLNGRMKINETKRKPVKYKTNNNKKNRILFLDSIVNNWTCAMVNECTGAFCIGGAMSHDHYQCFSPSLKCKKSLLKSVCVVVARNDLCVTGFDATLAASAQAAANVYDMQHTTSFHRPYSFVSLSLFFTFIHQQNRSICMTFLNYFRPIRILCAFGHIKIEIKTPRKWFTHFFCDFLFNR